MITKEQKKEIVVDLGNTFSKSQSVVFSNFHGLSVADASLLRRALRSEGVSYTVAKKTLVKRALDATSVSGDRPVFEGELSIAFGDDLLAPARGVYQFQKKLDGKISILGGIFEGVYKSKEEMLTLAMIPSMQTLRGMFVNIINSPVQRFVIGLNEIAKLKS